MIQNYTKTLEDISLSDQKAIKDFYNKDITQEDLKKINNNNLLMLKQIIKEIGFPTIQKTSEPTYTAAILILLHCTDTDFMEKIISLLENFKEGEIHLSHKAYLIDKSRVLKNLPQIYGTQYKKNDSGMVVFLPILDPNKVNSLRKEVGLEPLNEYVKEYSHKII